MTSSEPRQSTLVLIFANMIPLFGVLFFGWSLFSIMVLYWAENVIVGMLNVPKILRAKGKSKQKLQMRINEKPIKTTSGVLASFFLFHYGLFTLIHGVFVFAFFSQTGSLHEGLFIAFCSLFLSHYISYKINFIGSEEYKQVSPDMLFSQPYKRMVVLHITIIFGGFFVMTTGGGIMPLVILTLVKTGIDTMSHRFEHKLFSELQKKYAGRA